MTEAMLQSQLATLEEPQGQDDEAVFVDITQSPDNIVSAIRAKLGLES
jgi:gluconate kinase